MEATVDKESAGNVEDSGRREFDSQVGKISWRRV